MNKQRAKEVIDYLEKHGFVYPAWYLTRKKNRAGNYHVIVSKEYKDTQMIGDTSGGYTDITSIVSMEHAILFAEVIHK